MITANLAGSPDARASWSEAICAGLAAKLALKYAPERLAMLKAEWMEQRAAARIESRERGNITISGRGFGRARSRR